MGEYLLNDTVSAAKQFDEEPKQKQIEIFSIQRNNICVSFFFFEDIRVYIQELASLDPLDILFTKSGNDKQT